MLSILEILMLVLFFALAGAAIFHVFVLLLSPPPFYHPRRDEPLWMWVRSVKSNDDEEDE